MRVSFSEQIDGGRIVQSIGRVRAATPWHARGAKCERGDWQAEALQALLRAAEDFEADAVVGVGYEIDGVATNDLACLDLERVAATGIAVKLARN